ncbi:UDP-N-acetylglucosamine pyrophosphorylase [Acidipropionibacterium virtanenii]|uniref:Bifunctional protein GlmU n=1 Tax=Acidipropionibacterium virtanenii TaxID=2057246 RepID=A0A344UUX5_9ACTN|nr:UDP-N-acetylglucosamine pyrophosphorylase [Acidipropionibacterium virtanenii]AXE39073.1 Bifunctional protein GlmU [Acidipropionibacterium virtanenii]
MELRPRGLDKVEALIAKGVTIPNPWTVDLDEEVNVDRISGDGVIIHPGCRIRGSRTVISAGCRLGAETPMTIDNCHLGRGVDLAGGYAQGAVFLAGASMASGAHVRAGTLLEEQAGGAHTVGLKQTILFPFVTLGSLINFCDLLMAGGTSRRDHSEVGSSYIHFNFTPDGDKTTASMFGDVPRGVLLDRPPIFLGGQGGTVGPVSTGFGTVVGAGSVLRDDVVEDGQLVLPPAPHEVHRPVTPASYRRLTRILAHNVAYVANLSALESWYRQIRRLFFSREEFGPQILAGALVNLEDVRAERIKRLRALVRRLRPTDEGRAQLIERIDDVVEALAAVDGPAPAAVVRTMGAAADEGVDYLDAVQGLTGDQRTAVTEWLSGIVEAQQQSVAETLPAVDLDF